MLHIVIGRAHSMPLGNTYRHSQTMELYWVCAVTHHRFKDLEAPATHAGNERIALGDAVRAITIRYPLTMRGSS